MPSGAALLECDTPPELLVREEEVRRGLRAGVPTGVAIEAVITRASEVR